MEAFKIPFRSTLVIKLNFLFAKMPFAKIINLKDKTINEGEGTPISLYKSLKVDNMCFKNPIHRYNI